jgi:NitT/TauT family transport system substrate-binding protein
MIRQVTRLLSAAAIVFATIPFAGAPVKAETAELRIVRQYGLAFLPFMVMDVEKLYEKRAAELGIQTKPVYMTLGSNTAVNEALISGSVNIVTNGPPGFLTVLLRGPVGVPSSCCTTTSEPIDHWIRMRRFLARFSELV